jgi:hypothetical protein
MAEPTAMDTPALVRRTLVTVGAMVGACALVVGTLTLVATLVVRHAVAPPGEAEHDGTGTLVPAGNVHGSVGPRPAPVGAHEAAGERPRIR